MKTSKQRTIFFTPVTVKYMKKNLDVANNFCRPLALCYIEVPLFILLHKKFLQFDLLRAVAFQLNLKYLNVKITNLLPVLV